MGDWVRVARKKGIFDKGYQFNWTHELFKVVDIDSSDFPVMYQLETYPLPGSAQGELVKGKFYGGEMQKTLVPDFYLVEKVLSSRTRRRQKEYLVKWYGWGPQYNSWEPAKEVVRLQKLTG